MNLTSKRIAFGLMFVLLPICNRAVAQIKPASGWIDHKDSSGYDVQLPVGWSVETAKDYRLIFRNAGRTIFAMALPVPQVNGGQARDWIQPLLLHYTAIFPNAVVNETNQVSDQPDAAVARVTFDDKGKPGRASVMFETANGHGVMFAIAAPTDLFASKKPTLVRILQSVKPYSPTAAVASRASAGAPAAPRAAIAWVKWTDPNEQAFSCDVPKGWKVTGGMYRALPMDLRAEVNMVSPDGLMRVKLGDANTCMYGPPTALTQRGGIPEGSDISDAGGKKILLHFMEGTEYSQMYVKQVVQPEHPDVTISAPREREDIEEMSRKLAPPVLQERISAGETDFKFTENGRQMHGACVVRDEMYSPGRPGSYWTAHPSLFIAPASRDEDAKLIARHILMSMRASKEWSEKLNAQAAEFTRILTRNFQEGMRKSQEQFEKFSDQMKEMHREFSNTLNDSTDVVSSGGGTVSVGGHYRYYFKSGGHIVGNDTGNAPGIGFEPLKQLP